MSPPNSDDARFANPIRTAVIGLGRIGVQFHLPEIRRHPGFRLVGVVDPLLDRRREIAAETRAPAFAATEEMLSAEQPELVVVASPTRFHAEHCYAAYAAGAHVFCDKPVATSVAEFDRILSAAGGAGRKFLAYQPARLKSEVLALRAILAHGLLGPIHLIRRARCSYERRRDWQAFRAHGGGLLNNYGSHCLDELISLLGAVPIRTIFCQARSVATAGDAEDVVKATLVTENELLIDLEISQACALPGPPWQVVGARGAALYDPAREAWQLRYFRAEDAPALVAQAGLAAENRAYSGEALPWREEAIGARIFETPNYYQAVWDHLREDLPPPVSPQDTRRLLALIERCRCSVETGLCA